MIVGARRAGLNLCDTTHLMGFSWTAVSGVFTQHGVKSQKGKKKSSKQWLWRWKHLIVERGEVRGQWAHWCELSEGYNTEAGKKTFQPAVGTGSPNLDRWRLEKCSLVWWGPTSSNQTTNLASWICRHDVMSSGALKLKFSTFCGIPATLFKSKGRPCLPNKVKTYSSVNLHIKHLNVEKCGQSTYSSVLLI